MNPLNHEVLFIGEGKSKEALLPFWEMLGKRRRNKIIGVSIDMGNAYISAVKEWLPNALIVFDHFHIVKHALKTVNELRQLVFSQATKENKKILSYSKWILLKNPENPKKTTNGEKRLKEILDLNTPLTKMYLLKEDLRQIWSWGSYKEGQMALNNWLITAQQSQLYLIQKLADSINKFRYDILNWYIVKINSGCIESLNSKIKALIIRARGYRDLTFLKALIMHHKITGPQATTLL